MWPLQHLSGQALGHRRLLQDLCLWQWVRIIIPANTPPSNSCFLIASTLQEAVDIMMPYFWSAVGWYKSVQSRQWWTTKRFTLPTSLHLRCCLCHFLTYAALQQDGNGISRSTVLMRPDWLQRQMRLCSWIAFVAFWLKFPSWRAHWISGLEEYQAFSQME